MSPEEVNSNMSIDSTSTVLALAEVLKQSNTKIVFAESCTAGLVAATLGGVSGISQWLCGSAVVYREATKTAWLGVPPNLFDDQGGPGAVSDAVARRMAIGVLSATPEADWCGAITGHLGPQAPVPLDGLVYIAIAHRDETLQEVTVEEHRLPDSFEGATCVLRDSRRQLATELVLQSCLRRIRRSRK